MDDPDVWLVTADAELAERLQRLCDAASVCCRTIGSLSAVPARDGSALVLLGFDCADDEPAGGSVTGRAGSDGGPDLVLVAFDPVPPRVWRQALAVGAEQVAVLPEAESWLVDRLLAVRSGTEPAPLLTVVGGRGGAGASVTACALAVSAARAGHRPALVDADPLGGGLDLMLAAEGVPGLHWADLAGVRGRVEGVALVRGLPTVDGVAVLSWGAGPLVEVPVPSLGTVLDGLARQASLVVLDLPRAAAGQASEVLARTRLGLLVVTADVSSTAAAARICARIRPGLSDLRLVVRGPAPTGLPAEAVAEALDLPLAGQIRPEPGLTAALDRGEPPLLRPRGPLAALCRRLVDDLCGPGR